MWHKDPKAPHKITALATTALGSHVTIELAREHIFLAAHEALAHMGLLGYSIGAVFVLVICPGCYLMMRGKKKE